jgi:hopanoid C-2 methylase
MTHRSGRKRVLIVNCHADETRRTVARTSKIPQTLAPIFLAGWFNPELWDIRVHNELSDGPLESEAAIGRPDLVVLTGLVTALDRLRHVTAYAKTLNPSVVVVGGGYAVRAFPIYCKTFLDVVCVGDVEQIRDVVSDLFGEEYVVPEMLYRFDLAHYIDRLGYVESSRYCNFRCSFCTLSADGRKYKPYAIPALEQQIKAAGRMKFMTFLDNNFYGNDRASFEARVALTSELQQTGQFDGWVALVTSDFFAKQANLDLAQKSGCVALFSGVESFDRDWTASQNKHQNGLRPPEDSIRDCLNSGIVFLYGLMLDFTTRSIADLSAEVDFILSQPDLTLPGYLSVPIPIPRTPFFYQCLDRGMILPGTRVRDLDSTTISLRPLGSLAETARFVRDLQSLRGRRFDVLRHSAGFVRKYRGTLTPYQFAIALTSSALIVAPLLASLPRRFGGRAGPRTHISCSERLDPFYRPKFRVHRRYESYFEPTRMIAADGSVAEVVAADVEAARPQPKPVRRLVQVRQPSTA